MLRSLRIGVAGGRTPSTHNISRLASRSPSLISARILFSTRTHQRENVARYGATLTAVAVATGVSFAAFRYLAHCETNATQTSKLPPQVEVALRQLLGSRVSFEVEDDGKGDCESHGKDFSYHGKAPPAAVVYPANAAEVQKIVALCNEHKIPVIPYGSGTSLEGHTTAPHGGITIDFRDMASVVSINREDLTCTVQPGITWTQLNEALAPHGMFLGLDPGPNASIGGMISTSCSGTNAVRYGTMKEQVVSLRVVLPSGEAVKTGNRAKKSSAGYDLTHLFVGSEGTLGVVTEVTLRLQLIPAHKAVAVCQFPTIGDASRMVIDMIQRGVQIGKVELLDDVMMRAVNLSTGMRYAEKPTLFFEFSSSSSALMQEQMVIVGGLCTQYKGGELKQAVTKEEREKLWEARKTALFSSASLRPGADILTTDVCVPISRLADCIVLTKEDLSESFLLAPLVAHAGDGNFHLFILLDASRPEDVAEAKRLNRRLIQRAIAMEGTCTGEHGVGVGKKAYLVDELGAPAVELMRTIKKAIDPNGIMNPGKIIP